MSVMINWINIEICQGYAIGRSYYWTTQVVNFLIECSGMQRPYYINQNLDSIQDLDKVVL